LSVRHRAFTQNYKRLLDVKTLHAKLAIEEEDRWREENKRIKDNLSKSPQEEG